MERYVRLNDEKYYDCLNNTLTSSKTPLSEQINNLGIIFRKLFDKECLVMNLQYTRKQLILSLTEECCFRCEYCTYYDDRYIEEQTRCTMSFNTAKRAIDEFIANSRMSPVICVSFYGGEPLLEYDLLKECVNYIEALNLSKKVYYVLTTNGICFTNEICDFLAAHEFFINVSVDGPQEIHDRYRKDRSGRGTYDKILNNIVNFIKDYRDYCNSHLSFTGVLAPPFNEPAILDYFETTPFNYTMLDMYMTEHMSQYLIRNSNDIDISVNKSKYNSYIKLLMPDIYKTLSILRTGKLHRFFSPGGYCLPIVRRTFVSAQGHYYACERIDQTDENILGHVDMGIDTKKILKLKDDIYDFHMKNCMSCWAVRFCYICHATVSRYPAVCENIKQETQKLLQLIAEDEKSGQFGFC